jgi:hypothetical protein
VLFASNPSTFIEAICNPADRFIPGFSQPIWLQAGSYII